MKDKFFIFSILLLAVLAFAEPEVQIGPNPRTWYANGTRLGLPGLANIRVDAQKKPYYEGSLPSESDVLIINLDHTIKYGGAIYNQLTVESSGRIFLGGYPNSVLPCDGEDGLYPYVKAISNNITPISGEKSIPISWRKFFEHGDVFTVIEIGPFYAENLMQPLLCQVSFYDDGEIQVQYWNKSRSISALRTQPMDLINFDEKNVMGMPYVFNGNVRTSLENEKIRFVYATNNEQIFVKETGHEAVLREGWIAKSFNDDGPVFTQTLKNHLDVSFGSDDYSGGLLAYDFARENPVVGSFLYMQLNVVSDETEDISCDGCKHGAAPIYFWYFNENDMYPNQTDVAGYPYLAKGSNVFMNELSTNAGYDASCVERVSSYTTRIYPCAYGYSWMKHPGIIDTIIAPAIKMQTGSVAREGKITFNSLTVRLLQPQSIQFRPPSSKKITYEGQGGYLEIGGKKTPVSMIENSSVHGIIHVTPGFEISTISVNGRKVFDVNGDSFGSSQFKVSYSTEQNIAIVDFNLASDVKILVTYALCSTKKVAAIDPTLNDIIPSFQKTTLFSDPSDISKKVESYDVKDGFDRIVQTQIVVNPGKYLVSSLYLDEMGNTLVAPKSYIVDKDEYSFEDMYCQQCIIHSAEYYNGSVDISKERVKSFDYPYTEHNYHYGENRAIVGTSAGMGEASFVLSDKFAKTWKIPLKTNKSSEFFSIKQLLEEKDPNAIGSALDNDYINKISKINEKNLLDAEDVEYPYELTINLSYDGVFSQKITDVAGNVMAEWHTRNGETFVTRNEYYGYDDNHSICKDDDDEKNRFSLLKCTYVEDHEKYRTNYKYDDLGRVVASESPDRGRVEIKYDNNGRIRLTRDQKQINHGEKFFNVIEYDKKDRVILEGFVNGNCADCSFSKSKFSRSDVYPIRELIYGKPSLDDLIDKTPNVDKELLEYIVNSIEGVSENDVGATISYNDEKVANVVKLPSYNRLGFESKKWLVYNVDENAPVLEISHTYRSSGDVDEMIVRQWSYEKKIWELVSGRKYDYDSQGRLEYVYEKNVDGDDVYKLQAHYEYSSTGVLVKSNYYDRGEGEESKKNFVYSVEYENDIYGRITKKVYTDANEKVLYKEELTYYTPLINRVSQADHVWDDGSSEDDKYGYDDSGRLTFFSKDDFEKNGEYDYDLLNRLIKKVDGSSTVEYEYIEGSYQPKSIVLNGKKVDQALRYDASGKAWLDGINLASYKYNSIGKPGRITRYSGTLPASISESGVENGEVYGGEIATSDISYDESGTKVWQHDVFLLSGHENRKVSVPGIGVFSKNNLASKYEIERLDLVSGGHRKDDGDALYPMTDVQGNVRGYVTKDGVKTRYVYKPYGEVLEMEHDVNVSDNHFWQFKEFYGELGKYDFGARYFDPFLGLWMIPDPAHQYANPYSYGGDPVNFIDPTGEFAFGLGIVWGWDADHGWSFGLGAAMDFSYKGTDYSGGTGFNLSYTWNQDGSSSFDVGANGSWQYYILNFNAGLSYSYNSYSGSVLSTQGGVCIGSKKYACAGIENGYSAYWDQSGNFLGATTYLELYAEAAGGAARANYGYEWGLLGMEGRSFYAGVGAVGVHGEWSHLYSDEETSFNWGYTAHAYYGVTNDGNDLGADNEHRKVSRYLWIPELGSLGKFKLGSSVDETKDGIKQNGKEAVLNLVKEKEGESQFYNDLVLDYAKEYEGKKIDQLSVDMAEKLNAWLLQNGGMERVYRLNWLHPEDKWTYRKAGSGDYGAIEIMVGQGYTYSSYNAANNFIDHFFLDMIGYGVSN